MSTTRKGIECPPWRPRSKLTSEIQLHLCGSLFTLDKELLAQKSSKISKLLLLHHNDDQLSAVLRDIPGDQESMELLVRFCHGYEISLSTHNVVRVACLADYLGMTDAHSPNNLFTAAVSFFDRHVIPSWPHSVAALKSAQPLLQQALHLGLVDYCLDSLIHKALHNPRLLGDPILPPADTDSDGSRRRPTATARRNLFDSDWKSEDLTSLSIGLYAPVIRSMSQRGVPPEYLAGNICRYAKAWLPADENSNSNSNSNSRREVVEGLTGLLPDNTFVPCGFLSEMLRAAIEAEAREECRHELEGRLGRQLDRATARDLMVPSIGYGREEKYDAECVRRMLKHFYMGYAGPEAGPLEAVAEVVEEFLGEVAADVDMRAGTFLEMAEMAAAAGGGAGRGADGVYRAVDVYLEKHGYLTETEREKVCGVVDLGRLSGEACEHAARNERLPVRVVVQVLFVVQMKLREAVPKKEMEEMGSKVMELEKECHQMKREINIRGGGGDHDKKKKSNMWREVKRKFGCGGNGGMHQQQQQQHDCNCQIVKIKKAKKVHPR